MAEPAGDVPRTEPGKTLGGEWPAPRTDFHPPVEEYLQAISSLAEEGTAVIQARVAERLGKSPPSVSQMLDRLTADGYTTRVRREIRLTSKGQAIADSVIRKHRLAERLLVDIIHLPWHLIHDEAGRWEHVISDDVEQRLVALLDDPATCPHGNPIPGSTNHVASSPPQVRLADVAVGETVRFKRLTETIELDAATLRYLDDARFIPGRVATVESRSPDGTVLLAVADRTLALGRELCRGLFITPA